MNYYLYCLRRFARLILLLWIVFRIAPLAAQDRAARLDFQVRKATLDTFVRQLEDSTGFSFIYGEKVQLRQPVTLDVRQKTIEEILQYAFGQEAITFKISGTHILLGERPVSRKYTVSGYITDSISSETLIGANILESSCHTGTSTNPFGFYSLTLPEGETGLFFSYLGYETKHCRFLLSRDTVMNIRLQTNNQLSEIIVLSDKKETGIRATGMGTLDIPMTQIKNTPAILGEADILKTIQLMPGVQAGTEGFSGLYVRGGGPDQNLIRSGWYPRSIMPTICWAVFHLHSGSHEKRLRFSKVHFQPVMARLSLSWISGQTTAICRIITVRSALAC